LSQPEEKGANSLQALYSFGRGAEGVLELKPEEAGGKTGSEGRDGKFGVIRDLVVYSGKGGETWWPFRFGEIGLGSCWGSLDFFRCVPSDQGGGKLWSSWIEGWARTFFTSRNLAAR